MSIKSFVSFVFTCAAAAAFVAGTALAADPAVKCESGKLKEAGKYGNCRLKADSKAVKKGEAVDYSKCEAKFADKWAKLEAKAAPFLDGCPSEGDQASMDARITTDSAEIATLLASGSRYEDTELGTVIDHQTGLEWQKTDDAGGLTDKDNTYTWTGDGGGGTEPNGTAFLSFLDTMNGGVVSSSSGPTGCHAGHCDWRIPHIGELTTIVDCTQGNPCIDQSVFGPTEPGSFYWSSSTVAGGGFGGSQAWEASFDAGAGVHGSGSKDYSQQVRAVRNHP